MESRKEKILDKIETILRGILVGSSPIAYPDYVYENTVSYVDRQYLEFTEEDVVDHPKPWIIINNEGENIKSNVGRTFENKILVDIVGFVEIQTEDGELDSLMNSLQKDIIIAILSDVELSGLCDYLTPKMFYTVPQMIRPYGGFVLKIEITYSVNGLCF